MSEMTIKNKFFQLMQARGFTILDDIQGRLLLVPHYYKTPKGDRLLISNMRFVVFGGSDVPNAKYISNNHLKLSISNCVIGCDFELIILYYLYFY
jgi:hypothetical protein